MLYASHLFIFKFFFCVFVWFVSVCLWGFCCLFGVLLLCLVWVLLFWFGFVRFLNSVFDINADGFRTSDVEWLNY